MKKIVLSVMIWSLTGVTVAAPLDTAKNAVQAVSDKYFEVEAETMAPITGSIYAQPLADIVAIDQVESLQGMAQRFAELVNSYGPDQLYPELQKLAVASGYTLAMVIGAITTYQLYKHVTRPVAKK